MSEGGSPGLGRGSLPPGRFGGPLPEPRPGAGLSPTGVVPPWQAGARQVQPELDRLGTGARSVLVPGVVLLVLVFGGFGALVAGSVGVAVTLSDAGTFEGDDFEGPSEGIARLSCENERRTVRTAVAAFTAQNGRPPTSTAELVPGYLTEVPERYRVVSIGGGAVVEAVPGGGCAGSRAAPGRDGEERVEDAFDTAAESASVGLVGVGLVFLGVAVGYQGWWLATAYRCLPRTRQPRSPRRAYRPLVVYAVGALVVTAIQAALVASGVAEDEPLMTAGVVVLVQLVFLVVLVRALLAAIDMLGDVTFHFCGGHYVTSRLLRASLLGFLLVPMAAAVLGVAIALAGAEGLGLGVILAGYVVGFVVCPVVGLVSYLVAVVMAMVGIDKALAAGAVALDEHARWEAQNSREKVVWEGTPVGTTPPS